MRVVRGNATIYIALSGIIGSTTAFSSIPSSAVVDRTRNSFSSSRLSMSDATIGFNERIEQQQKESISSSNQIPKSGMNDKDVNHFMNDNDNQNPHQNKKEVPPLGTILRMLPKDSFEISTSTSLLYFGIDLAACLASLTALHTVVTSDLYHSFPLWGQALSVAPLQVLTGFALWCMWCIGHDAGHGTVSKQNWINHLIGEISHSIFCLTPFVPWKKSHLKHHLNHNHLDRDYSHQWFIREEADKLPLVFQWSQKTRNVQLPILYLVYLLFGVPDGGHVIFYGRMWENEPLSEKLRAAVSVAVSVATAVSLWMTMGTADFAVVIFAPWLVLSFWLFMVTYLQHHSDDGVLYTDDTWSFTRGAFETVDRDYGKWINRMSHHMMDGHVVHHLFFTKVPHYKLEAATTALQEGLAAIGREDLYKQVDTPDFTQEIIKQFDENWFFIDEKQVVREL